MAIPFFKEMRIGGYLIKQKLLGRKRYPLVLMLEPLFRCNLACVGCGKIDYPDAILKDRKSTRLNSSHMSISYAVFCLKKKKKKNKNVTYDEESERRVDTHTHTNCSS